MFVLVFKRRARLAFGMVVAGAALALAACHSSDDSNGNSSITPPVTVIPPIGVTVEGFIAVVKALIATTNESSEPTTIVDVTATTSETAEPDPTI